MIGYILIGFLSIAVAYWYHLKNSHLFMLTEKFPGPKRLPIIGNALMLMGKTKQEIDREFVQMSKKYGRVFSFAVGPQVNFVCTDPKLMEIILGSNKLITKSFFYDFFKPWLGNGLLISDGQKWHSRRKAITPAFHFKILDGFLTVFNQQSDILIDILNRQPHRKSIDIFSLITKYTLDVICETAMGIKVNAMTDDQSEYPNALKEFLTLSVQRVIVPWKRFNLFYSIFARRDKKRQEEILKILHGFTEGVIKERRELLKSTIHSELPTEDEFGIKKRKAFLDILLSATIDGKPLTDLDVREEVDTFMFEGHDTTASAISSALYLLSRNSDVQKKAVEEIVNVVGTDSTKMITMGDLNNLKYLDLVIKETLRLYPSVPGISRRITEDTDIGGNLVLPKDGTVSLLFHALFRNEKYFPEPNIFNPERFIGEENIELNNVYAYTPFSAGPRNCIGQKFAVLELKSALAKILMNFELLPAVEEPNFILEVIMRPLNGIHICLQPREL